MLGRYVLFSHLRSVGTTLGVLASHLSIPSPNKEGGEAGAEISPRDVPDDEPKRREGLAEEDMTRTPVGESAQRVCRKPELAF